MKKLFAYFKHPTECIAKEDSASIKSLILFYLLMQGIFILAMLPFIQAGIAPENFLSKLKESKSLILLIAFLPPILEELTFRLPLTRKRTNFMISFVLLASYATSSVIFSMRFPLLWFTILIVAGLLLGYFLTKPLQKVRFDVIFYVFAFLFGFMHIFNYAGKITSFAIVLFVFIYFLNKMAMGMFLGYIRIRYSIFTSIAVHFLNNFLPLMAVYSAI
ncbi:MAG: CPBP family glutamic-type intramembrane protease [Bacteroidales bacterium]|nr:CPBP family glutamic-type intramembrane protease [Bacteroidales bacterium]